MTSEERLDRIEHLTAGWIEQSKNEHRENRDMLRETNRHIQALADETNQKLRLFADEGAAQMAAIRAEMAERDKAWHVETAERDRKIDERIDKLVSAIGELIRGK